MAPNYEYAFRGIFSQIDAHVLYPDVEICNDIGLQLRMEGFRVSASLRTEDFISALAVQTPQIIIVPVDCDGMSGPALAFRHIKPGAAARVLAVAEGTQMDKAVEAVRQNAYDVIALPLNSERLYRQVRSAVEDISEFGGHAERKIKLRHPLTPRETQVLELIVDGLSNKEAAIALKISPRTVEVHRSRVMEKVGAKNTAALVRMVLQHRA